MSEKREVRKKTDFWGNEKEAIYENGRKVGEVKTEERGGFFGIGGESVKLEYDTSGREVSHSKQEERGGFLALVPSKSKFGTTAQTKKSVTQESRSEEASLELEDITFASSTTTIKTKLVKPTLRGVETF